MSKDGVYNIENGCYAKTISLTEEKEPEVRSSVILLDKHTRTTIRCAVMLVLYDGVSKISHSFASQYFLSAKPGQLIVQCHWKARHPCLTKRSIALCDLEQYWRMSCGMTVSSSDR
eukprot:3471668-Amphidinium_carterae.2